jgi:hypothetical protein
MTMAAVFSVLRPLHERTGEVGEVDGRPVYWERVSWLCIGHADSVSEAKERFRPHQYGYGLVLGDSGLSVGQRFTEAAPRKQRHY